MYQHLRTQLPSYVVHASVAHTCAHPRRRLERALGAAAASPFARNVKSWVLLDFGTRAKVATSLGARCRGSVVGYGLVFYPLVVISTDLGTIRVGHAAAQMKLGLGL